jgi:hypothetical protein
VKIKVRQLQPKSDNVWSPMPDSNDQVWPNPARLLRIQSDPSRFGRINGGRLLTIAGIRPNFGRILVRRNPMMVAGCSRISVPAGFRSPVGFRRLTIAGFRQSDIKRVCKNKEFNFRKLFTVLKIVNRFPKIKKTFTVKLKMIFVDHYFCSYQTP